jgi:hypothetical protein
VLLPNSSLKDCHGTCWRWMDGTVKVYKYFNLPVKLVANMQPRFIKTHYADIFRLLPESPIRAHKEEKWINSTTLLEAPENDENVAAVPQHPSTPEPKSPFVPTFSLSTPSGQSPKSLTSAPSTGSPLTPLQFMRRADADAPVLLPVTPSKPSSNQNQRARTTPNTPAQPHLVQPHALLTPSHHHPAARTSIWRP